MILKGITEKKVKRERLDVEQLKNNALKPDKLAKDELRRLNVEIHVDDWKKLRKIAFESEKPLADIVRNIISEYLKKNK
jgi:GDP-D-mannose dehydratase